MAAGQSRLDSYEYAMHGKVFKVDQAANAKQYVLQLLTASTCNRALPCKYLAKWFVGRALFVSFGGLLVRACATEFNLQCFLLSL